MIKTESLTQLLNYILSEKTKFPNKTMIIGISGIDASGKGFVSHNLKSELIKQNLSIHIEHLDGWLNLPHKRFSNAHCAEHFYNNGFRIKKLKQKLLLPYIKNGAVNFKMDYLEETWNNFRPKEINIGQVDIFILEGIFIFQESLLSLFDYKIWIYCHFETALQRAIARNQEGLDQEDLIASYKKIYFPAQNIHLNRDKPIEHADMTFINDKKDFKSSYYTSKHFSARNISKKS